MNTTLIIMAAGIGSRFGEGIKQLAQMGPNGEIIMDYSIHDAKEAGFNKVVFIIRKDIFEEFEEIIGSRIKDQIDVEYVFQELETLDTGDKRIELFIIYRWNRVYPADVSVEIGTEWKLTETEEIPGFSHEKITKEIYCRE